MFVNNVRLGAIRFYRVFCVHFPSDCFFADIFVLCLSKYRFSKCQLLMFPFIALSETLVFQCFSAFR